MFKIPDGGWFPLVVAAVILVLFTTWKTGRNLVAGRIAGSRTPLQTFVSSVAAGEVARVEGTAVFLYSQRETTPPSMAALVRATGTLHEDVHVVAVVIDEVPHVHPVARAVTEDLGHGVHRVTLRYGFMEPTRVADDLERHLSIHPDSTDFVVGREAVRSTARPGMARWREALYGVMVRNASDVAAWFHLPAERVLEVGTRVEI
jgi:KUP system potassium uptake protein